MRPLRTCDFCDADAIGTFEVVPPELEPTDDERRRVVLCTDCSDRLEALLEPLVARALEAEGASSVAASTTESTPTRSPGATVSEPDSDTDAIAEAGITFDTGESTGDRDASERDHDGPIDSTPADDPPATDDSATADDAAPDGTDAHEDSDSSDAGRREADDESAPDAQSDSDDEPKAADEPGIGGGPEIADGPVGDDEDEATTNSDPDADGESDDPAKADTDEPDAEAETDDTDTRSDDVESAMRPPRAYGKAVRLLRNREFPMDRDTVEQLAAGAYDLEDQTAETIVDYAIANDEFVERGGKLHRS